MRRIDIVLAVLFVAAVVGLVFLPDLIGKWRTAQETETAAVETAPANVPQESETAEEEARLEAPVDPEVERERVSGILMLHKACVNRFEGFDARSRETLDAWKQHHASIFASGGVEHDFHIVLAPRKDMERDAKRQADTEEFALCERNLEAMQADLDKAR